ncbi:CDP-diacylglycerol--serine O-phosphatidyltransferase [Leadbettera azotonutricia]|uniref:CDP-diacylglycerol--serine O-phosphatidyltransferase n=1 Tax=Leadbettera azotonutricia (strain ATCC BAA-888 / DSM 13862 / ZAS-9) TaxID=545695 RepID=F5YA14_LEAAZ|nr:CDP-diacylglycerol--serine O-phosphatidyltransferase [Leadbettera azotonutricia]AEF80170.1 CDP-diacylglycerol--serine O-phosphatidyltransferase [Leadbettera azotonutricia ZAS-9]
MKKEELKKGIYILPSLFTCGNMTFGLLSIMVSIKGEFIPAAWALVLSLFCDILDGRIARLTHTTSEFGVQLDSLSDLVSFGIAPAMLIYMLVLQSMGKIGVAIAVFFVLCSAMRLARFNVKAAGGSVANYFQGLPTPASAGVIISFVLSYELLGPADTRLNFRTIPLLMQNMPAFFKAMPIVMVVLSFLMVSNIPYYSFKHMELSKPRAVQLLVFVIVLAILIIVFPQNIIFIIFSLYALSGFAMLLTHFIRHRSRFGLAHAKDDDEDEE